MQNKKSSTGYRAICILARESQINDLCMKMHIYVRCKCRAAKLYSDTNWISKCFAFAHAAFVIQCVCVCFWQVQIQWQCHISGWNVEFALTKSYLSAVTKQWSELPGTQRWGVEGQLWWLSGSRSAINIRSPAAISVVKGVRIVHNGLVRER